MSNPALPASLSIPTAARTLSVSERFIWKLLASGEIRGFKIGKRRLIPETEIARLIERRLAEAAI